MESDSFDKSDYVYDAQEPPFGIWQDAEDDFNDSMENSEGLGSSYERERQAIYGDPYGMLQSSSEEGEEDEDGDTTPVIPRRKLPTTLGKNKEEEYDTLDTTESANSSNDDKQSSDTAPMDESDSEENNNQSLELNEGVNSNSCIFKLKDNQLPYWVTTKGLRITANNMITLDEWNNVEIEKHTIDVIHSVQINTRVPVTVNSKHTVIACTVPYSIHDVKWRASILLFVMELCSRNIAANSSLVSSVLRNLSEQIGANKGKVEGVLKNTVKNEWFEDNGIYISNIFNGNSMNKITISVYIIGEGHLSDYSEKIETILNEKK